MTMVDRCLQGEDAVGRRPRRLKLTPANALKIAGELLTAAGMMVGKLFMFSNRENLQQIFPCLAAWRASSETGVSAGGSLGDRQGYCLFPLAENQHVEVTGRRW